MTIKARNLETLVNATRHLDGDPKRPFKFSGKTRYALAKNLGILKREFLRYETERLTMIRSFAPDGNKIEPNTPEMEAYAKEFQKIAEADQEIAGLLKFNLAELNLDVNDISIDALSELHQFIIEDDVA